jgi:hypothetical protein
MSGYAHPCALLNKACVERLSKMPKDNNNQLKQVIDRLSIDTPINYIPRPLEHVNIGPYGAGVGHVEFTKDSEQAVQQAVMFCCTKKEEYIKNAINILRSWSEKCRIFEGTNAPLECGWGGCSMARAAEIIKHCYGKWDTKYEAEFNSFLDKIIIPNLKKKLGWTNNWQLTICEARLQIAIYRNDKADLDWAISEYKRILGLYVLSSGQTAETLRDLVHAQFGIGSLVQIPELIYEYTKGVVDLFVLRDHIIHKVVEFHADLLLGNIPINSGITEKQIKEPWFLPCGWEIALHHYQIRFKKPMPKTEALLQKKRPEKYVFHWGLGTLTHYAKP